ncbi:FAD-dependent oxidoreductase [Candidatus Woesearchaeota archaeon]|nr:FAD-dependent oxidoreductase [Candidatus Woesearchaeota archaeon]
MSKEQLYDLAIIGGGAAGITAAIYAARYKLKTILITKEFGGVAMEAHNIENYPGFPQIAGIDLMKKFVDHLKKFEVDLVEDEVGRAEKNDNHFSLTTKKGKVYNSKTLIIAVGTQRRKLDLLGEEKFVNGKGISYCYTCDAPLSKNKTVAVVGGGDSAVQAALLLSKYATKIYLLLRGEKFKAEPIAIDHLLTKKNVEILYKTNVVEVSGEKFLKKIKLNSGKTLDIDGLFVEIGAVPSTFLAKQLGVAIDENSHVTVTPQMETNIPGVYAAGDIVPRFLKQLVVAASDGAIAATTAYNYLMKQSHTAKK